MRARSILFAVSMLVLARDVCLPDAEIPGRSPLAPDQQGPSEPPATSTRAHRIVTHAPGGPLLESPILSRLDYYRAVHAIAGSRWSEAEGLLIRTAEGDPSLVRAHLLLAFTRLRQLDPSWILSVWDAVLALLGNFRAQGLLVANAVLFGLIALFLLAFAASAAAVLRALPSLRHAIEDSLPTGASSLAHTLYPAVVIGSVALLFRPWGWGPGIIWLTVAGVLLTWRAFARGEKAVAAAFLLALALSPAALKLAVHVSLPATPGTTLFALSGMPIAPLGEERVSGASSDEDVLFTLALLERERGNREKSMDLYREILDEGGEAPAVYNNIGNLFFVKGEVDRAFAAYRRALDLDARRATSHYNLGQLYLEMFSFDRAREEFSRASEIDFSLIRSLSHAGSAGDSRTLIDDSIPARRLWGRFLSGRGGGEGITWREATRGAAGLFLPPRLHRALLLAAALAAALAYGRTRPAPVVCLRCGRALCRKCRTRTAGTNRCAACARRGKDRVWDPHAVLYHRPVALSLSLLLPGMGHFYLGRKMRGLVYGAIALGLLLVWTFRGPILKPFPVLHAADLAPLENLVFAWLFIPLYLFVLSDALRLIKRTFRQVGSPEGGR